MKKKVLFIINPVSGVGKQKTIEKVVAAKMDKDYFDFEFTYTQAPKHAIEISKNASGNYDIVVAIGGDGTVNEVGQGLLYSQTALAIIPTGSGNGLARFLKIPVNIEKAVKLIHNYKIQLIDTATINDKRFVNVAGVGFDAHISHKFANFGKRGFLSYIKLVMSEFLSYQPRDYTVIVDDNEYHVNALMITVANSSQFGNNAHVAPFACIDDGVLDICIINNHPKIITADIALRLFLKTIHHSKYVKLLRGKSIRIIDNQPIMAHTDGEPVTFGNEINIQVVPKSLKVITG
jgi:YegS/Rv2252/BmrU family lipid kinase